MLGHGLSSAWWGLGGVERRRQAEEARKKQKEGQGDSAGQPRGGRAGGQGGTEKNEKNQGEVRSPKASLPNKALQGPRPLKSLTRPFKGLISPLKSLIRAS